MQVRALLEEEPLPPPTPVGKASLDTLAALVPAELLVLHATVLSVTTETKLGKFVITEPGVLRFSFWALIVAIVAYYAIIKASNWDGWDYVRMLIPAVAFVGWTMLQKNSAFDAEFTIKDALRIVVPAIVGFLLAGAARSLAYKADETDG
jgi:hypothetical protein